MRAIELHKEQHAAIVNYSTYKAAANALQALQGESESESESERESARAYIMFTLHNIRMTKCISQPYEG